MKTAIQELIEFIDDKFIVSNSPQISSIYYKAQELLEKEKQHIIDAASNHCYPTEGEALMYAEQYYNQTYNQ
jgi:hypothetical protein